MITTFSALYCGLPHPVYIEIIDEYGYHPAPGDITVEAWITTRPTEVLTQNSGGCDYDESFPGHLTIQCGTFPSQWQADEIIHFKVTYYDLVTTKEDTLTYAGFDYFTEPLILELPSWIWPPGYGQYPATAMPPDAPPFFIDIQNIEIDSNMVDPGLHLDSPDDVYIALTVQTSDSIQFASLPANPENVDLTYLIKVYDWNEPKARSNTLNFTLEWNGLGKTLNYIALWNEDRWQEPYSVDWSGSEQVSFEHTFNLITNDWIEFEVGLGENNPFYKPDSPDSVYTEVVDNGDSLQISWFDEGLVYNVYSSDNPNASFPGQNWTLEADGIDGNQVKFAFPAAEKRFYVVTADNVRERSFKPNIDFESN